MSKIGKIAVTILLIFGFLFIGGSLLDAGSSKTFVGLLGLGIFYGIRKMWRKPKEKSPQEEITLDKNNNDSNITKK